MFAKRNCRSRDLDTGLSKAPPQRGRFLSDSALPRGHTPSQCRWRTLLPARSRIELAPRAATAAACIDRGDVKQEVTVQSGVELVQQNEHP